VGKVLVQNVHRSSGFSPFEKEEHDLPEQLWPVYLEAKRTTIFCLKKLLKHSDATKFNPKNENILVSINGKLVPRGEAKISVFDSVVQGGDAVWEGLRVYNGKIFSLADHLTRLHESAHAMMFEKIPSKKKSNKSFSKH